MLIRINKGGDAPLYRQIIAQIRAQIASGKLGVGDRLPSVRELAVDIRINPNTVARAYRELEAEGVIETRGALGSFVAPGQARVALRLREQEYRRKLRDALATAVSLGLDEERARAIYEELAERAFEEGETPDERRCATG